MNLITNLFVIYENKTTEITQMLFEPCLKYIGRQAEELYQQTLKLKRLNDCYYAIYINNTNFYRPKEFLAEKVKYKNWLMLDESLLDEGIELENFVNKVQKDVRFIQMWLSLVIDEEDLIKTRSRMPTILANQIPGFELIEFKGYEIPKGKENVWKQAENLITYYLGMKMLL